MRRPVTAGELTRSYFAERGYSFVRLPQSGDEVDVLGGLFAPEAKVLKGEEATEEAVKARCGEARYVHFACHGHLDPERGMESALILSLPRRAGRAKENGFLQAWEIFGLKLNADLVTLSACETGLGEEMAGEGIIGLTRAFMYAGTPSVVVSLWRVSDESTSLFMQSFYGHLKAGDTKDVALQEAMQELRANPKYSHPLFWAPFVLVGDYR